MEIRRTALGEGHPDYATSLNNLAGLYRAMGRHAEAEPLYKQAMEIRRTALGEGHPDYATSLNNLAGLYRAMGRHAEAEALSERAMEIGRLSQAGPDQ
jgi:tetratricopeptide (TPR) repeat protein